MPKKTTSTTRSWNWQELDLGISTNVAPQFVVFSDSDAVVGQEGREGERQPQLEFFLLRSAASLAMPRHKTAKRFWAGTVAVQVKYWVQQHPQGCSVRVSCYSNSWAGMCQQEGPWTGACWGKAVSTGWTGQLWIRGKGNPSALVNTELWSQLFHLCSCQHQFFFCAWPFWTGEEPKPKSHLWAMFILTLLGSGWKEHLNCHGSDASRARCVWGWFLHCFWQPADLLRGQAIGKARLL